MKNEREGVQLNLSSEIQMEASRWVIDARTSDDWAQDDQAALNEWLNSSIAHKVAYLRAEHAWGRTVRAAALKAPKREKESTGLTGKFPFLGLKLAAAIGAIAVIGVLAAQYGRQDYTTYRTPIGGRQLLNLSDGSHIELNTNSVIRIAKYSVNREVIVDRGEVYFDVKHDAKRPFVVFAADRKILDLGTKFLVRDRADRLEVAMYEGRVRLDAPKDSGQKSVNLTTGDVAVATARNTTISRSTPAALSDALSWRHGVLVFHHTTLAEAAAEFNRYNDYKVIVADSSLGRLEINGKFRTTDVGMFADVAADVLGLHVKNQGGYTLIER
ncbi:MAG TPA: FecR domain-containing protein [Rhizomicrobium sp.]|nr:FecR domain-containing protein [Rhizomicrobium sp.]